MSTFWARLTSHRMTGCEKSASQRIEQRRFSWRVELMEERTLLSTFQVSNTADSGEGSLRQAILDANSAAGADLITFAIDSGIQTIQPLTALPEITDPVTIDGSTQTGFAGSPLIVINGDLLPPEGFVDGLVVNTANSLIKGLVINGFDEGTGIVIGGFGSSGVMGNRVEGSIIGLNAAGKVAVPNADGIRIAAGATQNTIGGIGAAGNLISGNSSYGVLIQETGTAGNRVIGNTIGTDVSRLEGIGNGYGVAIGDGASGTEVGGTAEGEGNLISGNVNDGIFITGATTTQNLVLGNKIGTNGAGTARLGDFTTTAGIALLEGTHDNMIGGTTPGARNQIAGISGDAILISDAGTHDNLVLGNWIGLSADGSTGIPNDGDGILIVNSSQNTIGGDSAAAGNVIAASGRNGITVFGATATGNIIWANMIGTDATGMTAIPNATDGIRIDSAGSNVVGGSTSVRANLISGNTGNGVTLVNSGSELNQIQGNLIGVAANATTALANGGNGISISDGASQNVIGGSTAPTWNVVAFNGFKGIEVTGATSQGNTIRGNRIHSNQFLAIDLNGDGSTANDAQDSDAGPHGLQNFPVLDSVNAGGELLFVAGSLNAKPNSTFTLEFYASATDDGLGNGQGAVPISILTVTTNANGSISFSAVIPLVIAQGQRVTATATDSLGNTSEFSASKAVGNSIPTNPILTLPGQALSYQLRQPAVILDSAATVTDPDSANFNTGKLSIGFDSKKERGEKVGIRNQGDGPGQIGVKGSNIKFGGVIVGKARGGGGGAGKAQGGNGGAGKIVLTITFNANATPAIVSALLKNLTYTHTGKKLGLTTRTVKFQVTDEAGHVSNVVDKLITLSAPEI